MEIKNLTPDMIETTYKHLRGQMTLKIPADDVEDMIQDVWVEILESLQTYRGASGSHFQAWVYSIGRNLIGTYYRKRNLWNNYAAGTQGPGCERAKQLDRLAVMDILQMAGRGGGIVYDYAFMGYQFREMCSGGLFRYETLRSHYRRARERIRKELGIEEGK